MKGTALFAAVMILGIMVALAVGFGVRLNLFGGGEGAVHKTSLQSNIYTAGNALDAARLYMETSLGYSVYQACHDTLAREDIPEQEFLNELESTTETYLNRYADENYAFLYDYRVIIPKYSASITAPDPSKLVVSAVPSDEMTISASPESGESVTLQASADVSGEYDIPCYSLFLKGQELNSHIKDSLENALKSAVAPISEKIQNSQTGCNTVGICDDLTEELKGNLKPSVPADEKYKITSEITDASVVITSIDSGKITGYRAAATQRVTISERDTPKEHYYPVWNGSKITFDNLKLIFTNKASNTF